MAATEQPIGVPANGSSSSGKKKSKKSKANGTAANGEHKSSAAAAGAAAGGAAAAAAAAAPAKFKASVGAPSGMVDGPLQYGDAPESQAGVNRWLDAHDRKFGCFINNKWVHPAPGSGGKYRDSVCPATGEVLAQTYDATNADVDEAMGAARKAFPAWAALSPHARAKHLYAIARHIQKHARLLAVLEALDNGKSFRETKFCDVPLVARHFYHHAGWAQLMPEEMAGFKPCGVVAEITPWNFPLMLMAWKVCPALAMGNTVVLKPASVTRLTALLFAEICAEAGLPPGVFNLITGSGRVGSYMADHPEADKLAFTGSTEIGRLLRRRMAGSGKKISLELGGKSPVVVFESADLDSAVEGCVNAIWFNQGQVCSAGSRLIVQESIAERFIAKLKRRMNTFRISHPLEKDIDMGALVDKSQFDTINGFIDRARKEGADVFQAQVDVPKQGYFCPPTLITNCSPMHECVREEIFGPVLAVMTFRDPNEAIQLANNTKFGLGGSVWTEDIALALEVAISIKAGAVWINAHNLFDAAAGFGGYRESGFGRDGGKEGLYEYVVPTWYTRSREHPADMVFPVEAKHIKWPSIQPGNPAIAAKKGQGAAAEEEKKAEEGTLTVNRTLKVYIGGKQKRPDWQYSRPVTGPDGRHIGEVAEGNRKDIRDAVEAAHKAAPGWGKRAAHNRAQILYFIAENLEARRAEFVRRIEQQTGRKDGAAEVDKAIERLFYYAAYADKYGGLVKETTLYGLTCSIHEPTGVVGILAPEKYPLLGFVSLVAPAVVRGNTVVAVPSTAHPLSVTDLYQVFDTSDLPGGVVNIVTGDKDSLAKTLSEHQDVQSVWYFGTAQGSRNVEYAAADNMKRTWCGYGKEREWMSDVQGQGGEFLRHATQVKNVWVPMGECK